MPYFSRMYRFREHCWDLHMTDEEFALRLARRLFDADMPDEAVRHYLDLAAGCPEPRKIDENRLAGIGDFVARYEKYGTRRNRDTLMRMREAVDGARRIRATTQK
jgi:hypothetical protein